MYLDISRSVAWMLNTSSQNQYHYFNSAFKNLLKKGPILISNHPFGSITQCMKNKLNVIVISNHYITSKLLRSKGGNSQCFTFLSKYRLWNLSKIDHLNPPEHKTESINQNQQKCDSQTRFKTCTDKIRCWSSYVFERVLDRCCCFSSSEVPIVEINPHAEANRFWD